MGAQPNLLTRYGPQNIDIPFTEMLTQPLTPAREGQAAGWAHPVAGAAHVGLRFLEGVRQQRVKSYLEKERESRDALSTYMAYGQNIANREDLTEDTKEQFAGDFFQNLRGTFAEQTKDASKDKGVGGLFRKMLIGATGGEMKSRPTANLLEDIGRMEMKISTDPTTKKSYWVQQANELISSKAAGLKDQLGYVPATDLLSDQEVQKALDNVAVKVSPQDRALLEQTWQKRTQDPLQFYVERMVRGEMGGGAFAPQENVPAVAAPPQPNAPAGPLSMFGIQVPGEAAPKEIQTPTQAEVLIAQQQGPPAPRVAAQGTGQVGGMRLPTNPILQAVLAKRLGIEPEERLIFNQSDMSKPVGQGVQIGSGFYDRDTMRPITLGPDQVTMKTGSWVPPRTSATGAISVTGALSPDDFAKHYVLEKGTATAREVTTAGGKPLFQGRTPAIEAADTRQQNAAITTINTRRQQADTAANNRRDAALLAIKSREWSALLSLGILAPEAAKSLMQAAASGKDVGTGTLIQMVKDAHKTAIDRNAVDYGASIDQFNQIYRGETTNFAENYRKWGATGKPPAQSDETPVVTPEAVSGFRKR